VKPKRPAAPKPTAKRAPKTAAAPVGYSGKPILDKLGVKPGMRVAVLGLDSERAFLAEVRARAGEPSTDRARKDTDMVIVRVDGAADLARLSKLEALIRRDGSIWAVWPKGQKHIGEGMIRDAALARGLVDVKVCAFSETLSALKLVIPLARR
jgi:hypothetical protein